MYLLVRLRWPVHAQLPFFIQGAFIEPRVDALNDVFIQNSQS